MRPKQMMLCVITQCLIAVGITIICITFGFAQTQKIDELEARKLTYEGIKVFLPGNDENSITLMLLRNKYDLDFYYFYATATHPNGFASPHLANFAVNPWTGDVWDSDSCERITSTNLKKQQDIIRQRFGFAKDRYASLKAKTPLCDVRLPKK